MKKYLTYILVFALVAVSAASCGNRERRIPRSKMAKIYADMFMADQWLIKNYDYRAKSDTTLFYEAVFNKYGYDSKDFRYSMEYYLRDPLRYSRMLKKTSQILKNQKDKLESQMRAEGIDPNFPVESEEMLKEVPDEGDKPIKKKSKKKEKVQIIEE